jgi:RNA polymerase sigma factor (sigma-70 family)
VTDDQLVRANAWRTAQRYLGHQVVLDVDDLRQIGYVALEEARRKYDGRGGTTFQTFATQTIRQRMLDEIRRLGPLTRKRWSAVKAGRETPVFLQSFDTHLSAQREALALFEMAPAEDRLDRKRQWQYFRRALTRLTPHLRRTVLARLRGERMDVIGRREGVTRAAIELRLKTATKQLRKAMGT